MLKILKAGIIAQGIEERMHLGVLQNHGLFRVSVLELGECLLFVTESKVRVHKRRGRTIAVLLTLL